MSTKKDKGQFFTTNAEYILSGLTIPDGDIIEPFAGNNDLIKYIAKPATTYDIDPQTSTTIKQDTIMNPPIYTNSYVITNPPYLARNKASNKVPFDKYNTNDLYKCFLSTFINNKPLGGILILPSSFLLSPRKLDIECRQQFMSTFRINKVNYFEERVFADTATTVIAFEFTKSDTTLHQQTIPFIQYPTKQEKDFTLCADSGWIIGGEIYDIPTSPDLIIARHIEGQQSTLFQTYMTLSALDSGTANNRINLSYKKDHIYPAKESSRTYATILASIEISEEAQQSICAKFNQIIEEKRKETWSFFLPQYRESKEYARKRIPFTLAYKIINNIITFL
jgi:hypothetical protein